MPFFSKKGTAGGTHPTASPTDKSKFEEKRLSRFF